MSGYINNILYVLAWREKIFQKVTQNVEWAVGTMESVNLYFCLMDHQPYLLDFLNWERLL
jgi:hypothetical protein